VTIIINIHEAKTHFSKLLQRVLSGEEVIIAKAGRPVARLMPYTPAPQSRVPGSASGQVIITPEFDEPLPEFEQL
jgi:prevent-host-death family protein